MFSARILLPLSLSVLVVIYKYFRYGRVSELSEGVDPEILDWIRTLNPAVLNRIRNHDPALLDVIRNLDPAFPSEFFGSVDDPLNLPSVPSPAPAHLDILDLIRTLHPAVPDGGSSENRSGSNFTSAASSAAQSQVSASKRLQKKKSLVKPGHGDNTRVRKEQEIKQESISLSAEAAAAQEACEKWRLRGNQAYSNGDLSKADCYTQAVNCVSRNETSRSCLSALMLCYSNRAATRMALGRIRDALGDCMMAAALDPNFLKVQVRASNCYLALGEVEDALQHFRRCLQLANDVCVDRKIAVEASDGLQKAQDFCIQLSLKNEFEDKMDRQWIQNPNRCAIEYLDGIDEFIEFATTHNLGSTHIRCPCRRCNNSMRETFENVRFHLVRNGMIETYTTWYHHGERLDQASSSYVTRVETVESNVDPNEQVMDILNDVYPYASTNTNQEGGDDDRPTMDSEAFKNYEKLLKNAKQELYPGCDNFSVLTAIVELMHGKTKFRLSNKCFDYFLGVIKRMLPKDNCLPEDHKSAQKVLKGLGLGYEKIHACVNNCILFYKENMQLDKCPVCNEPRFKMTSQNRKTKIPQKIMRYLPLKPRLQRLYMSMHTATDMRWHKERRVNDDVMRHPVDGEAWKEFDRMYPDFAADPRNVDWDLPLTDLICSGF